MLTRALDTRVAEAAQLRKALEVAKREAARMHAEMDELRQVSTVRNPPCIFRFVIMASTPPVEMSNLMSKDTVCLHAPRLQPRHDYFPQQAGGGFESQLRVAESVMRQSQDSVSHHLGRSRPWRTHGFLEPSRCSVEQRCWRKTPACQI